MKKLLRSIEINAPVESVYEFLTTPSNLPSIWPSLVAVTNVERKADGSHSFDWTYKMAGVHFHGRAKPVEAKPNRLIVTRNEEGIPSTFRWTFEPKGAGTYLTLEIEYTLPTPIIGPIAEAVLAKMNERELETLLVNAKSTLESQRRVQPSAPAMAH